jgi:hypothetical protein
MPASYGGASGTSLPDTPDDVLLDFANRGKAIILDQTTGEGLALSVATLLEGATGEATETAASGDWLVGDGTGGAQLASAAPGDVRAVLGITSTGSTLYAADGTPVNGGGTASVSGTGITSTFTLTGAGTSTYGSSGVTSPSISFTIPAGASVIEVEVQITALTNVATAGYRFLGVVLRNSGTSTPTAAWGVSQNDNGVVYGGGLLSGLNGAPYTSSGTAWPFNNIDRWQRATLLPRAPQLSVQVAPASAGARPTTWTSLATPIPLLVASSGAVPDTGVATALAIVLQSFSAGASTVTGRVTVRVTL